MTVLPSVIFFLFHFMSNTLDDSYVAAVVQVVIFSMTYLFVFLVAVVKGDFLYDNINHIGRFSFLYFLGTILVVIQCFLPEIMWFFLPLAVLLALFSSIQLGICSYMLLLYLQMLLTECDYTVILSYTCIGIVGIMLFAYLDYNFLFGVSLFSTLLFMYVVLLSMEYVIHGFLRFDAFLYAAINLFISFLLITASLKYISYYVLHKNRDKYQEINDPEFILLTELKATNPRAYYHAVHTAYFSEKIARKIGADEMLAKAGGYYHKIGKMRGPNNLRNTLEIAENYHFPPQLVLLLKEYGSKNMVLRSKEAAIVLLADAMVSSVMFLFEKDKNARLDYEQIVDVVFKKQLGCGVLDQCEITMEQLTEIKTMFTEETLYYDFLR